MRGLRKCFELLFSVFVICCAFLFFQPSLAFGQGATYPTHTNWPSVSWSATGLTLNYTSGTINRGITASSITGATLTLTDTKNTCTVAAIQAGTDACNYVYDSGTGSALSSTVTYTTAVATGHTLLYLCSTVAGNITACTDTAGILPLARAFNGGLPGRQPIIAAAATLSPTIAQCGSLIQMGATTGEVVTLPPPVQGCSFDFLITVTNTSNSNEIRTDSGSTFLAGSVAHSATGIAALTFWADGTSTQALKMDGAHLGGLIFSNFHVLANSATQWEISGTNLCTATCTTGFNATP